MTALESLVTELGLRHEAIDISALPLEPPSDARDAQRFYLVDLWRSGTDVVPLRVVYVLRTFGMPKQSPSITEVLFYLAAQASQIDRSESDRTRWLAIMGIDVDDAAAESLFSQQVALTEHLCVLLGQEGYAALIRCHRSELAKDD